MSLHWLTGPELRFQGSPTMERLAAVSGLVALVGSEGGMIQVRICLFLHILILYIYTYTFISGEIWPEGKMGCILPISIAVAVNHITLLQ